VSQAGVVLLCVAVLWIAYLVPHLLRYRQQLLESRTDDRFSEYLRVVRVARATKGALAGRQVAAPAGRVLLHPPAGRGGGSVDRPHALADRVVADAARRTATERAQRAAYLARRSAGAHRRAVLAALLLVLAVAGWVGAAAGGPVLALGLAPTALLAAVLVLGRRAVLLGRRADADWASGRPAAAHRPAQRVPTAVGHAVRPSEDVTEVMARVAASAASAATAAQPEADFAPATADTSALTDGPTWVPVPVPRPAYALKPAVRRPEPAPLALGDAGEVAAGYQRAPQVPAPATGGIDLDAILARRRAAGE